MYELYILVATSIAMPIATYFIGKRAVKKAIWDSYIAVTNDLATEEMQNMIKVTAQRLGGGFFGQLKLGQKIPNISIEKAAGYGITKLIDHLFSGGSLKDIADKGKGLAEEATESLKL